MNRILSILVTGLIALTLAACGGASGSADHNQADTDFVQGMIPHHRQAVEMAQLAADRASSPAVRDLADRIQQAQGPEIDTMNGFLKEWGEQPAGDSDMGSMAGMEGMMSDSQMSDLMGRSGAAFDQMFLQMMIDHHTGAVQMSQREQEDGQSSDATALAEDIEAAQTSEIAEMRDLLDGAS